MDKEVRKHICFKESTDGFIMWLVEILGPVLLQSKPAEILSFQNYDKNTAEKLEKINEFFSKCNKIKYIEFPYKNNSTKILFYNPEALDYTLRDKRNIKVLKNIGYPENYTLESYTSYIVEKMSEGCIPDEIGIFLGYPLKDVLGFIGHPSLKLTKVRGWRVYGDSRLSDLRYDEFIDAKYRIKNLLKQKTPQSIILSA